MEAVGQHRAHLKTEQRLRPRQDDTQFRECLNDAALERLPLVFSLHRNLRAISSFRCASRQHIPGQDGSDDEGSAGKSCNQSAGARCEPDRDIDPESQREWQKCRLQRPRCTADEARCGVTCLGDLVECRCGQQKARGHENRQQRDTVEHLQKRWQTPEAR